MGKASPRSLCSGAGSLYCFFISKEPIDKYDAYNMFTGLFHGLTLRPRRGTFEMRAGFCKVFDSEIPRRVTFCDKVRVINQSDLGADFRGLRMNLLWI